jgi:glycerol-3-phosphate O-acyltransferase / dihydroxyacetone phosphate acyltransferase
MTVLYKVLRPIARLAVELYFLDIQASGAENVPTDGPVILASNHPNSIVDVAVLSTQTQRHIHYMAKSVLFKNPLVKTIFNNVGVIPVYRIQDNAEEVAKNQDSFIRAFETLEQGRIIGIFPEGENSPDRQVQQLKTGTARIALTTEARNKYRLGLVIVPVGLNFDDRDRFLSSVLIRYGKPIAVADFADLHRRDEVQAVRALTDKLQEGIREQAVHIHDERNHQLVIDIHRIYGSELLQEIVGNVDFDVRRIRDRFFDNVRGTPGPKPDLDDHFQIEQFIADVVDYHQVHDPGLIARTRMDVRRYKDHLAQVRLRHDFHERPPETISSRREALAFTIFALVFSPIAAWGFLHNAIPFLLVRHFAVRAPDEALRAWTTLNAAIIGYPLFYSLFGYWLWKMTDHSAISTVFYILSLPVAGFFFLRYWRQILVYRDRILSRTLFRTQENLIRQLNREREQLVAIFEGLKNTYLEATRIDGLPDEAAAALPDPAVATAQAEVLSESSPG